MQLQEYLKALRSCPNDLVRSPGSREFDYRILVEYGVYDNYPIFLHADHASVIEHLKSSPNEHFPNKYTFGAPKGLVQTDEPFFTTQGSAVLALRRGLVGAAYECQNRGGPYNMTVILHGTPRSFPIEPEFNMVDIIEDFCNYAVRNKLPLRLPRASGLKHLAFRDADMDAYIVANMVQYP
jgi:hypothetical protein